MFEAILGVLGSLFVLSLAANIVLFRKLRNPDRQETYELKEFLSDILSGEGLVRVQRVAPTDVLIRSPRDMR